MASIGGNGIRAALGLLSGVLIARGLSPSGYGDLMFLMGSFVAIRSLLDMGSSNAFYTFLSQRARGLRFYLAYIFWLGLQFSITLSLVAIIIPQHILDVVWLGHNREIIIIAFLAAFMQQQVWQVVSQIGESMRKTVKVQLLNLTVSATYLAVISILLISARLSTENILLLIISQYGAATVLAYGLLREHHPSPIKAEPSLKHIVREFLAYCRPLAALSLVGFLYDFADKWLLQRFGGATQQGYFQIASQFANISLLATASILSVFWKEIAASSAVDDHTRVANLYHKVSRGLVILGAVVSGLLLPWSKQIVIIVLGEPYAHSWPVLAIMLLYPIHQSMGQIGGAMFLASGQTQKYMLVSSAVMLTSIPLSYIVLAPTTGELVPGFGMGAIGIAVKLVLVGVVSVNIQAWVIARFSGWTFDWLFQLVGIPAMIGAGYFSKSLVGLFWDVDRSDIGGLVLPVMVACVIYMILAMWIVWLLPWLIGMERDEIRASIRCARQWPV